MTYTPADPYTPYFPGSTTLKPDTILNGQDIQYSHVAPLWDEVIKIQNVLRGQAGAALFSLSASTGTTPLAVQGLVGQTADLFKVSSSSSELFKVAASGKITSGEIAATAATNVFGSYLAVADAQPSFRVSKTGGLSWGVGGSSSTDTNFYRGSAGLLRSDGDLLIGTNSSAYAGAGVRVDNSGAVDVGRATNDSGNALTVSIDSESQYRFRINSAGSLGWSAGSGSIDATLARSGSAALTLTGSLAISSALTVNGKTPVYTDNSALTDTRAPTGPASGDLTGTYPAPTIKSDVALPGAPTTTTASTSDNSTKVATTYFVKAQGYATLASPSLTGTPLSITAAVDTNTTQIATTAFVIAQGSATGPANVGTSATIGTSTRFARADHAHSLPTAGTAGTYNSVTTDAYGRVTAGSNTSYVAAVTGPTVGAGGSLSFATGPSGPTGSAIVTLDVANLGVTNAKLAGDAVTSDKILNGTILLEDLAEALKQALVPTGTIQAYAGVTAPTGWYLCYGQTWASLGLSAGNPLYDLLYAAGFTTGLPDLRGRAIFGKDDMGGTAQNRITSAISGITGTNLGASGGHQALMTHGHANSFGLSGGSYSLSGSAPSLTGSAPTLTDPGHTHSINANQNSDRSPTTGTNFFSKWLDSGASRSTNSNTTGITISGGSYTISNGSYALSGSAPTLSGAVTNYTSSNTTSANMPPAIIMNYIIKA